MNSIFTNILVPINFNRNTSIAMEKAIAVANELECDLYVLHVPSLFPSIMFPLDGHLFGFSVNNVVETARKKLDTLVLKYSPFLREGLRIQPFTIMGNWQTAIKSTILSNNIDLLLIPGNKRAFWGQVLKQINIDRISQHTQCSILTINKKFELCHFKNIVVAVSACLPFKKLKTAAFFAKKYNSTIHLKSPGKDVDDNNDRHLLRAYRLLKDSVNVSVQCNNSNGALLEYAETVDADLIVVCPGNETHSKKWPQSFYERYLYRRTTIPVLTMSPQ